jgi:catechol 2,3-dioxygenase-like lactoylglutathione lyase family enzyme
MLRKFSSVFVNPKSMKKIVLLAGVLTAAIAFLVTHSAQAQNAIQPMKTEIMYQDTYPVYISKDIVKSRDFYTKTLGFEVAFESSFFILLTTKGTPSYRIGFLSEQHPSSPPSAPALKPGAGVFLTLQVEDAKSVFDHLVQAGVKITYTLTDEPWGQRRFGVTDPNGMYVDIVEQTEPQPGFWEKYKAKN